LTCLRCDGKGEFRNEFGLMEKWGDEEYKKKLQELVMKDDELISDVIKKIKLEKGLE